MIKTIIFDLGGVIMTLEQEEAKRRFVALGLEDVEDYMNQYTQSGIFGDLESGKITGEEFRVKISEITGREVSYEACKHAWLGYKKELPQRNIEILKQLRKEGFRLVLLSNTNEFMVSWAESDFDGKGGSIKDYFDAVYYSFQMRTMKPDTMFFRKVLMKEKAYPEDCLFVDDGPRNVAAASELGIRTFCPENGADWTEEIRKYIDNK